MVLETTDPSSNLGGGIIRVLLGRDQMEHSKKSLQSNATTFLLLFFRCNQCLRQIVNQVLLILQASCNPDMLRCQT